MIYVFDTNVFSQLFRSYYPDRFPSLWQQFDQLVANGQITSTDEVIRELEHRHVIQAWEWANEKKHLFPPPTAAEAQFVAEIFQVKHFQQIISQKTLYKGGRNADPFIIARAATLGATVVTMEGKPKDGARIPNICEYFGIPCVSLEGFMKLENWRF